MSIKLLSIIFLILLNFSLLKAQTKKIDDKDYSVYESVLTKIVDEDNLPVYYHTDRHLFVNIDFKTLVHYQWKSYSDSKQDWKQFAVNAKTNRLKEHDLQADDISGHAITKQKVGIGISGMKPYFTLSPIVYSADGKLALCAIQYWGAIEDTQNTVFILEVKDGHWVVIKSIVTAIS